jgi:CRP/FNR family cyclic AMP-dependent transcriptional regulator
MSTNASRIEALQNTAMFGAVNRETVAFLLERARVVDIKQGDYFFREGERGGAAFLLERGRVSILKAWNGQDHFLRHLGSGDCFGEVALLDFGPRSGSVLADVDSLALEISAKDLTAVSLRDAEQFALIYMNLGRELSRRLRDADDRLFRARLEDSAFSEGYAVSASSL